MKKPVKVEDGMEMVYIVRMRYICNLSVCWCW